MTARAPQPPRVRRRVPEGPPPEEAGHRRGCMLAGGTLGIIAGALVAIFVLPPLINYYFGTADVEFGKTYTRDTRKLRVLAVERQPLEQDRVHGPVQFAVHLDAETATAWELAPEDFELELSDGNDLTPLPPDDGEPRTSLAFDPGSDRELILRFPPLVTSAHPSTLSLREPRVRFALPKAP